MRKSLMGFGMGPAIGIAVLLFFFIACESMEIEPKDLEEEMDPVTDIDGNEYETVKIGNQVWMAENLKVAHYRNGDEIPCVTDTTAWIGLTTGACCEYNNDPARGAVYGKLYNGYAATDGRNIAPEGWHVPTDEEWKTLEMYLGMTQTNADRLEFRGPGTGNALKESGYVHWDSPNTGANNASGFTALPGGERESWNGGFQYLGMLAGFWTSSPNDANTACCRFLSASNSGVYRNSYNSKWGLSVRCVKD